MEYAVHDGLRQARRVFRADHDVPQFARAADWAPAIDGERENVGGPVDASMLSVQGTDPVGIDELDREMSVVDSGGGQCGGGGSLERGVGVELDQACLRAGRRPGACFSACSLYAATIRCTSLCRTTSSPPKRTKRMPSTPDRMSPITTSPERRSRSRSICVMSPVTTIFELKPSLVRNIFICSGVVFCASSRMMKLSFSVRPRMNASGATSIVPRSRYWFTRSGSSMS